MIASEHETPAHAEPPALGGHTPGRAIDDAALWSVVHWAERVLARADKSAVDALGRAIAHARDAAAREGLTALRDAYITARFTLPLMRCWGALEHEFRRLAGCGTADVFPRTNNEDFERNAVLRSRERERGRRSRGERVMRLRPELKLLIRERQQAMAEHARVRSRTASAVLRNRYLMW